MYELCLFEICFFPDFQNWGVLVLLLLGSEVALVGHHLFCIVWMSYVVSGTQIKDGEVFLVSLQKNGVFFVSNFDTFPPAPVMTVLLAKVGASSNKPPILGWVLHHVTLITPV